MKRPAYSETVPSHLQGLCKRPKHWEVVRGRFVMQVNPAAPRLRTLKPEDEVSFVPMEAVGEYGGLNLDQTRALADVSNGYTEFEDGDVVVAKITPCFENGKAALASGLVNSAAYGTTELHVLRADPVLHRGFLFYVTISERFRKLGESEMYGAGGQKRVPPEFNKDFPITVPPLPEQQQIAAFLDWKTGQIDALISRKQALLEKLKEKRLAIITQAVTRGLNSDAPLRDSGIPWLGHVPHHWQVRSLKFCFDFLNNRRIPLSSEERANMARDFPYYGASGIIDYVADYIFDEPLILIGEDGANLLSRSTPLAFEARGKYWVNNHAHILRPSLGPFTYWSNLLCIVQYAPWITGAAQPKLTKENLGSVPLPCPPVDEQNAIADFIEAQTGKIDPLIDLALETIARLSEYRTAFITAATTGKIDVRNAKIPESVA